MKWITLGLGLMLAVAGCSGGGSDDREPVSQTGGLTITFGDNHVDGFDKAIITVDSITLLGAGGQSTFAVGGDDEPVVVDLLQLRNVTEMVFDGEVEAHTYNKIRLSIADLELQVVDDAGQVDPSQTVRPRLPANGRIDLNPQGPFEISPGEDVVVQIDIDLDRSIHITETGSGQYNFRPIAFVEVIDNAPGDRLTRLHGTMENKDEAIPSLDLCNLERLSDDQDTPTDDCIDVHLDESLLVDAEGAPTDFAALVEGEFATVFGRFRFGLEAGDEYFQSLVLAVGDEDNFEQIHGDVSVAFDGTMFTLADDESESEGDEGSVVEEEAADSPVVVKPIDGAVVIGEDGLVGSLDSLVLGAEVEALGRFVADAEGESFHAFLIYVEEPEDAVDVVDGDVLEVLEAESRIRVDEDGVEACVTYTAETEFLVVDETTDVAEFTVGAAADLAVGAEIEAKGAFGEECLAAEEIIVEIDGDGSSS